MGSRRVVVARNNWLRRAPAILESYSTVYCIVFFFMISKVMHIIDLHNIIESVDSISRDGPDTPIYIILYKKLNNSEQEIF